MSLVRSYRLGSEEGIEERPVQGSAPSHAQRLVEHQQVLDAGAKEISSKTEWALGGMGSWCLTMWVLPTVSQKIKRHLGQGWLDF